MSDHWKPIVYFMAGAARVPMRALAMVIVSIVGTCAPVTAQSRWKKTRLRIANLSFGVCLMTVLRQRLIDDLQLRGFSPHTQLAYVQAVARFARHFKSSPDKLGPEEVRRYLLYLVNERHVAWSTYNVTLCALRFFYQKTLGRTALLEGIPWIRKRIRKRGHH
jgi:hypothetical protein